MFAEELPNVDSDTIKKYKSIAIPLIRRTFPELIAQQLVGVQPMTGPVGLAYAMRFRSLTFQKFVDKIKPILEGLGLTAPSFEKFLPVFKEEHNDVETHIVCNHWLSIWFNKEVDIITKNTMEDDIEQLVKDFILKERKEKLGKLLGE